MKKSIKNVLATVLMTVVLSANAYDAHIHVYGIGDSKLNVEVSNIRGKAVSYIKDGNGKVLFERRLKEEGNLSLTFDLNNLSDGTYTFTVEDKFKRMIVPFQLAGESVEVDLSKTVRLDFPQLVKEEDRVLLKFLSNDARDLEVNIRSKSGEVLFQDEIHGVVGMVGKQFRFAPGEYVITMTCQDFTETKYFSF